MNITPEEFAIYEKVQNKAWEVADIWHEIAFRYGRSGYSTDKVSVFEQHGEYHIIFYRQMNTSGIGYYQPERVTLSGKYIFDDSTLIADAYAERQRKIQEWERLEQNSLIPAHYGTYLDRGWVQ